MAANVTPVGSDRGIPGPCGRSRQQSTRSRVWARCGSRCLTIRRSSPGGFAEARITGGTTTAPLLPQSAVLSDDKGNYVYIVNAKNEVERRDIKIGTVDDNGVTIAEGLSGNDRSSCPPARSSIPAKK